MTTNELKARTKQFALRVMTLVDALPNTVKGRVIANQIMRSATSVGANYRSACRARSKAEFISKIGVVEEEADELIIDSKVRRKKQVDRHQLCHSLSQVQSLLALLKLNRYPKRDKIRVIRGRLRGSPVCGAAAVNRDPGPGRPCRRRDPLGAARPR